MILGRDSNRLVVLDVACLEQFLQVTWLPQYCAEVGIFRLDDVQGNFLVESEGLDDRLTGTRDAGVGLVLTIDGEEGSALDFVPVFLWLTFQFHGGVGALETINSPQQLP